MVNNDDALTGDREHDEGVFVFTQPWVLVPIHLKIDKLVQFLFSFYYFVRNVSMFREIIGHKK